MSAGLIPFKISQLGGFCSVLQWDSLSSLEVKSSSSLPQSPLSESQKKLKIIFQGCGKQCFQNLRFNLEFYKKRCPLSHVKTAFGLKKKNYKKNLSNNQQPPTSYPADTSLLLPPHPLLHYPIKNIFCSPEKCFILKIQVSKPKLRDSIWFQPP